MFYGFFPGFFGGLGLLFPLLLLGDGFHGRRRFRRRFRRY